MVTYAEHVTLLGASYVQSFSSKLAGRASFTNSLIYSMSQVHLFY